jgi:hypothetical protein
MKPEFTPVLVFGRSMTARVATAGLNPSESEFLDEAKKPFRGDRQRFLHWKPGDLTEGLIAEAFRRSEGYFNLGNAYGKWFDLHDEFLEALRHTFATGEACHTDYVSPFVTSGGISNFEHIHGKRALGQQGLRYWVQVLGLCPHVEVIFGHGRGWNDVQEQRLFGITEWEVIETPFDNKGLRQFLPPLKFATGKLPNGGRPVLVYWWRPNRNGSPLCNLNPDDRTVLGKIIRKHARQRGHLQ